MLIVKYWSMFHLCAQPKVSLVYLSIFLVMAEFSTSSSVRSLHSLPNLFSPLIYLLNLLCVSAYSLNCPFLFPSPPSFSLPFSPLHSARRHCCLFQIQSRQGGYVVLWCWSFLCSHTYWGWLQLNDWIYIEKFDYVICLNHFPTTLNSQ